MKKLIAVFVFTSLLFIQSKAQDFYLLGGVNFANITKTASGQTENNNMLTTFNVGGMGRFGLSKIIDLESGLIFTGRGSKAETYFNNGNDYVKSKFNPYYLELPLNLVVRVPIAFNSHLFFHAGPYIAVGVAGKSKMETKVGPVISTSEETIKFSNDNPFTSQQDDAAYDKLKRFDYGMNLGGGFQFKHLLLRANYGLGFSKINSTESNNSVNDKNKYRTISLSIGIPL
jgi:hypothetical protein